MRAALRVALAAGAALGAACSNAGQDRVLGVQASGVIRGLAYVDRNGDHSFDMGDTALAGLRVRLIITGTADTVARALSDSLGVFRFSNVPVGTVVVAIDSTSLPGDSLVIAAIDVPVASVTPNDSVLVHVRVGYPELSIAAARTQPVGKRVFVAGITTTNSFTFGDSTLRLADVTAAILLTRVKAAVLAGDSGRFLATLGTRNGQPTLDSPTLYLVSLASAPVRLVSTAGAATADTAKLDAALISVAKALVKDTATVAGNRHLTVDDGSGPLVVQLDTVAGFRAGALNPDTVGATLTVTGVLAPMGSGAWLLLPRSPSDVVAK